MQDEHFWGRAEPGESGTPKLNGVHSISESSNGSRRAELENFEMLIQIWFPTWSHARYNL